LKLSIPRFKNEYIITLFLLFPFVYLVSPVFTIISFSNSIKNNDSSKISTYINYPQLRKNFKSNITSGLIDNSNILDNTTLPINIKILLIKPIVSAVVDSTINSYSFYTLVKYGRIINPKLPTNQKEKSLNSSKTNSIYSFSYPSLNVFILKLKTPIKNQDIMIIWKREQLLSWKIHSLYIPISYIYDKFNLLNE